MKSRISEALIAREEYQIAERTNDLHFKSHQVVGHLPLESSEITFTKEWVPLTARFSGRDYLLEVDCKEESLFITEENNRGRRTDNVPGYREDIVFLVPGAISIPFLWTRNVKEFIHSGRKYFQGFPNGTIEVVSHNEKVGSVDLWQVRIKMTVGQMTDLIVVEIDPRGKLLKGVTKSVGGFVIFAE